jgi:hypothetical protein
MQIFFFVTEDRHDRLFAPPASKICVESDICPASKAQAECSCYVWSLTPGVCRCYQVSSDKY